MITQLCKAEQIPHHELPFVNFRQNNSWSISANLHQEAIHQLQFGLVV
jgi:hypothetical protein